MKQIPKYQKAGKIKFKLPQQQSKEDQEVARNAQSLGILNPTILKSTLRSISKDFRARYNKLSTKEKLALAKKNMPHSEIVTVKDQHGNIKTSTNPKAGAMSGTDPVGEFIVGTASGNLGLGLGKIALSKMGQNAVTHWARNSLLNETAGNLTKNISQGITNNLAAREYTTGDNPIMQLSYYKPTRKAWSTRKAEGNEATSYFFKQQPNQRFELVKDVEPNNYSVHFKTDRNGLNYGNKMQLFAKVADELPEGANLSTWGSISKGGIHGINRFGKDFGFIQNGTRQLTMKGTKEPVEVGIFQKSLNHHLQGDDAIKMFKEYGGTPIPEGSLNGDQLRKYVMEARERYGLIDNPNISDEEIAQALYKHTNELGKGSAAINSQGEPQLLFRGDTKPYTKLKVNHNQIGKSDTEDNVLGTMFLDRTGIGEGWGPDRYMYLANQDNKVMAPYRNGIETESFTTLQPKFKSDYVTPVEGKGFVGDFDISYPYYKYDRRYGVISGGKVSSEAFADGYTNQLNGFVVRTPHERDITNEVYTNGMGRIPKVGEEFQWRVPHTTDISSAPRETRILQNKAIIKDAQQKNQGLLRSKAGSPYRDEHDKYDYLVVPDFNARNVKHILPYDLRIPRNWLDPNIFRVAAPIGMSLPFLNNSQK